ncbi:MAG: hydroxyacid dehydrogenase [Fusobacteriaceae bacterium]|jgi:D-3-phosphoglycerate dehydrogenase|nr:hydroxyacid dehydrogenase [Fusobacteriaceae bacterium]
MVKLVMTQAFPPEGMVLLEGKAEVFIADDPDPANYMAELKKAQGIIIRLGKMTGEILAQTPDLRVIAQNGVGYDNIDVAAATARGVPVVYTPGANARSVAEHTMGMILALDKKMLAGHLGTLAGKFMESRISGNSFELYGKTIGVIGLGNIGKIVAELAAGFGMKILGYDPFLPPEAFTKRGWTRCADLPDLLRAADVVTVHTPLNESTKNLIALRELSLMKPEAILVNCARGGVVSEADLAAALEKDLIAGAALDVFEMEPPDGTAPLLRAKNLLVTPHSAAQTKEAALNMMRMCVDGCLAVLRGERWPCVVDPGVWNHPRWQ